MTTTSAHAPRTALTATVLAMALGLTACASGDPEDGDGATEAVPDREQGRGDNGGTEENAGEAGGKAPVALTFDTRTVGGDAFSGTDLVGEPAVLWFWAPWCTICRGEAPGIAEAAERYSDDVEFIGVAGLGEVSAMQDFVSGTGTDGLTHVVDEDGSIWSGFGVAGQPAFAFVDADGGFETVQGTLPEDDLDAHVDAIVDGS